jgi:hypothetical protein
MLNGLLIRFSPRADKRRGVILSHIFAPSIISTQAFEESVLGAAVVVGTDTQRGTRKAAYTEVYRYTATYMQRNGQWRTLAEHLVKVPKAK